MAHANSAGRAPVGRPRSAGAWCACPPWFRAHSQCTGQTRNPVARLQIPPGWQSCCAVLKVQARGQAAPGHEACARSHPDTGPLDRSGGLPGVVAGWRWCSGSTWEGCTTAGVGVTRPTDIIAAGGPNGPHISCCLMQGGVWLLVQLHSSRAANPRARLSLQG